MNNTRGVTLLELAVALAIIAMLAAAVLPALRQTGHRTLHNASLQLQADLRYAQQRAIREGRPTGIIFDRVNHLYRIVYFLGAAGQDTGTLNIRIVHLPPGVELEFSTQARVWFHPRGTPSGGFRVILQQGGNIQHTTVSVSGGRAYVWPINQIVIEY